jgi:hypothetical protein
MRLMVAFLLVLIIPMGCLEEKVKEVELENGLEITQSPQPEKTVSPQEAIKVVETPAEGVFISSETDETGLSNLTLITPEFCKNEVYWRYSLEKSIYCALNERELLNISYQALELKGIDIKESVWNLLKWEKDTIEYDWDKASLPPPEVIFWSDGRVEVIKGKENIIQTPTETIQRKKGVCGDYAILTIALLVEMAYKPVYLLDIRFESDRIGHVAAAIRIDNQYFAIDQHPPVLDLGSYYKKWAEHRGDFGNKKILNITIYRVEVKENRVVVANLENLTAEEIKQFDYTLKVEDLKAIQSTMMMLLEENFPNLRRDENLKDLEKRRYLPLGYREGGSWKVQLPYFAEYYNPVFHDQFTKYLFEQMLREEIVENLTNSNRFWINVREEAGDLSITLHFARKTV